jgi:hypothetical protein
MRLWELWRGDDGEGVEFTFFDDSRDDVRNDVAGRGHVKVWEVRAKGRNAAHQARNDHLGWGRYSPMLGPDGSPFPEDEDDDWSPGDTD